MFFTLSKVLWFLVEPENLMFFLIMTLVLLAIWQGQGMLRKFGAFTAIVTLVITTLPVGQYVVYSLENRFPQFVNLPQEIDGIIVLGGAVNIRLSQEKNILAIGGAAERLIEGLTLARQYPEARLVYTGGSGSLTHQTFKEADIVGPFLRNFGVNEAQLVLESESRNTHENAVFTYDLVKPASNETWLLVTSASHMPRAMGAFRQAGWDILPYAVDFSIMEERAMRPGFSLAGGLNYLSRAVHECLGLLFYYLTDRTNALFPGPGE